MILITYVTPTSKLTCEPYNITYNLGVPPCITAKIDLAEILCLTIQKDNGLVKKLCKGFIQTSITNIWLQKSITVRLVVLSNLVPSHHKAIWYNFVKPELTVPLFCLAQAQHADNNSSLCWAASYNRCGSMWIPLPSQLAAHIFMVLSTRSGNDLSSD